MRKVSVDAVIERNFRSVSVSSVYNFTGVSTSISENAREEIVASVNSEPSRYKTQTVDYKKRNKT